MMTRLIIVAALVASTWAPGGQIIRTGDPVKRGHTDADFPRIQKLAEGVYSAIRAGVGPKV